MTDHEILYSVSQKLCIFKLSGYVRHSESFSFNMGIKRLFRDNDIHGIIVDLTETKFIDSSNLGLLGILSRTLREKAGRSPVIVCPRNDVYRLLLSMNFDKYFTIIHEHHFTAEHLHKLPELHKIDRQTLLDAHRQLIDMSESNRTKFRDVVELLEKTANKTLDLP